MKRIFSGVLWGFFFCCPLVQLQARTLDEALTKALLESPVLRSAQWGVRDAFEAQKSLVARAWLPQVRGEVSTGYKDSTVYGAPGNDPLIPLPPGKSQTIANPFSTALRVSQPLLNPPGGSMGHVRAGQEEVEKNVSAYAAREQTFLRDAIQAFLGCATAVEKVKVNRRQVENYLQDHRQKTIEFDLGSVSRTELSRVESKLAEARGILAQAEASVEAARAEYTRIFGEEPGDLVLPSVPDDSLRKAPLERVLSLAETRSPALLQARSALRQADAGVQASRMGLLPSAGLEGSVSKSRRGIQPGSTDPREEDYTGETAVMATLSVPLYNPEAYSKVRSSVIRQVAGRLDLEDTRRKLRGDVISAFHALKAAEAGVNQYEISVKAAEDALNGTRLEAEMGARTFLDVLLSETDLRTYQVGLLEARQKYLLAFYELCRVCGVLTPERLKLKVASFDPAVDYKAHARWLGFRADSVRDRETSSLKGKTLDAAGAR
jgi:outer membrane protein